MADRISAPGTLAVADPVVGNSGETPKASKHSPVAIGAERGNVCAHPQENVCKVLRGNNAFCAKF